MRKAKMAFAVLVITLLMSPWKADCTGLPIVGQISPDTAKGGFLGYNPYQVVVKLKTNVLTDAIQDSRSKAITSPGLKALTESIGAKDIVQLFKGRELRTDLGTYFVISFAAPADLDKVIARLSADKAVVSVEPDPVFAVNLTPNDQYFNQQWYHVQSADRDLDTPDEWNDGTGDSTILVGITDTGVLYNHPDLSNNIWINQAEYAGTPGIDDDNNGYVDDIRGWDFVTSLYGTWQGEDGSVQDNDPKDFNGHGTHIAGIIGAVTNNGTGIAGIAGGNSPKRGVAIVPLRIGGSANIQGVEMGIIDQSAAAEAFDYAVLKGIDVLNCSWGSLEESTFSTAVVNALNAHITLCVAAGNDNMSPINFNAQWLATLDEALVVAAIDSFDVKASFSNFGPTVDVSAPGVSIYSTHSNHYTAGYAYLSGTSMAAPMVAGVVALIKSKYPNYTESEIQTIIRESADNISAANPDFPNVLGGGRLNAKSAVDAMRFVIEPRPDVYENPSKDLDNGYPIIVKVITASALIPDLFGRYVSMRYMVEGDDIWTIVGATALGNGRYRTYVPHQAPATVVNYRFSARNSFGTKTSATKQFSVLAQPNISASPNSFDHTLGRGVQIADTLLITNTGAGVLNYSLLVEDESPIVGKRTIAPIESIVEQINDRVDVSSVPTEYRSIDGKVVTAARLDGARAAWTIGAEKSATDLNVAILGSDLYSSPDALEDIASKLASTSQFASISVINTAVAYLSYSDLKNFDAVLVHVNYQMADPDGLGDALADFCDAGGGVVLTTHCYWYYREYAPDNPYSIGGRFASEDYRVINQAGLGDLCGYINQPSCANRYLAQILAPTHPLFAGVSSFQGGSYGFHYIIDESRLEEGATSLGTWSDGAVFAAARRLSNNSFNRLDLNFLPYSADVDPYQWPPSTSGALLMANALSFVCNSWVTVSNASGSLLEDETDTVVVSVTAPDTIGEFSSIVHINSNAPTNPSIQVPVHIFVPGVILTSPDASSQWCNLHYEMVNWISYPNDVDSIRLLFRDSTTSSYRYSKSIMGSASSYNWRVPSYWGDSAQVKIVVYSGGVAYEGVSSPFVMRANGDLDCDHSIDISDLSTLIYYLDPGGIQLCVPISGDVNADGLINEDDVDYLVDFLWGMGPVPQCFGQ